MFWLVYLFLPVFYFYHKEHDEDINDMILDLYRALKPETNSILDDWYDLGFRPSNALESQAFLYLHKSFCTHKKCLNCSIGFHLLKS